MNVHSLNVGYTNFLPKDTVWNGVGDNFTVKKSDKNYLRQVLKINAKVKVVS